MTNYQVVWKGPLHWASGLGIASRAYADALKRKGVDVALHKPRAAVNKRKVLVYHYFPHTLNYNKEKNAYHRILINTVWETTRVPRRWLPNLNKSDAVFVPSYQNKQAMRNSGVRVPVFIVPHGVNSRLFHPGNKKLNLKGTKGKFVFVSVFGFQHRKNPEALLRAYWEEFSAADNVVLVIKTNGYSAGENQRWISNRIDRYKKQLGIRKKTAPVIVIASRMSANQLKGIYTLGNAFVLPTRGEGVGLPFLESLASGLPVIATGWGGHMDFLNNKNAFLVPYKLRRPTSSMYSKHAISRTFSYLFAGQGQLWAEPDLAGLKRSMRLAYKNPSLCKAKGRQGRKDMLKLSWTSAGGTMKRAIEKVITTS